LVCKIQLLLKLYQAVTKCFHIIVPCTIQYCALLIVITLCTSPCCALLIIVVYNKVLCPHYCSVQNAALYPHHYYYYCMHTSVLYLLIIVLCTSPYCALLIIVLCTIKYCALIIVLCTRAQVGLLEAGFYSVVTFLMTRTAYFMSKYIYIHIYIVHIYTYIVHQYSDC